MAGPNRDGSRGPRDGHWAAGYVGLRIRDEAGLRGDRRTGLGGIRHVAAGRIAFEMEERATAVALRQYSVAGPGLTHNEHGEVCRAPGRHRSDRPLTSQLNSEHGAGRNRHDRSAPRAAAAACSPLRLRDQRIERGDTHGHSTIIASTSASYFADHFEWKKTIGPIDERPRPHEPVGLPRRPTAWDCLSFSGGAKT